MHQNFSVDPSFDEYLGPDAHKRLLAVTDSTADGLAKHGPSHAVTKQWALAGYSAVRSQLKNAQVAWAQLATFIEAVGAQAIAPSRLKKLLVTMVLALVAGAEANLAFPGVRFSLGRIGQINSPFEDPLSLIVAVIIGLVSVAIAEFAAHEFSRSERSLMKEPIEPEIHHHHLTPRAVHSDEPGNARVLEASALGDYVTSLNEDPLADLSTAFPASAEVEAEEARHNDEAKRRFDQVLRGGRSCGLSRKIGLGLVALGIGLWTMSGIMRVSYLSHIHPSTAPVTGGILGSAAPTTHPASLVSAPTEVAIILFSILLFLASVAIVFALSSAAQLRAEELRRHAKAEKKQLLKTLEEFEKRIRDHVENESKVELAKLKGKTAHASERIPREDF